MLIIFDMGNVLLKNVFEMDIILKNNNCILDMDLLYRDKIMDKYSSGLSSEDDYWNEFNSKYGTDIQAPQWGLNFCPEIDLDIVILIQKLKNNHRVVCGSNSIEPHWDISQRRGDYNFFDNVYLSHVMGVSKPELKFWEIILEKESYEPKDVIFIDDFSENIEAANSIGINGILYSNIERLKGDLSKFI